MLTIKEYAKNKGVTYEAIRKQLKTYEKELQNHIVKNGRTQLLDDYAVDFLDNKRASNTIIVERSNKDEEIERLKAENDNLHILIEELQRDLLAEKDKVIAEKDKVESLQKEKMQLLEDKQPKRENLINKLFNRKKN